MARELIGLLARHGSTLANQQGVFRSMLDPELDDSGIQDADELASVISRKYKVYKIISSPMLRAVQTADIIGEKIGVKVKQDRGLLPWHLGILTGRDKEEYDDILEFYVDNPKLTIPEGQSLDDFEGRVEEFLNETLKVDYQDAATGTPEGGYDTHGPYSCKDCIHKTSVNKPYCIHPEILNSAQLKDKIVKIGGRRAVPIDLEHGCCEYVKLSKDEENKIQLLVTHTSCIVAAENLSRGNRDGRPEAGEESVGPGGLAEIYSTDDGYDIVPVLKDDPAKLIE